jgi:hypothetical protein
MLLRTSKICLMWILVTPLIGCGFTSMGESHLASASDQRKAIENNPNLSAKDKAQALSDIDRTEANTHSPSGPMRRPGSPGSRP